MWEKLSPINKVLKVQEYKKTKPVQEVQHLNNNSTKRLEKTKEIIREMILKNSKIKDMHFQLKEFI